MGDSNPRLVTAGEERPLHRLGHSLLAHAVT